MQSTAREKLQELQSIITKLPLEVCCVSVLPELGLRWREVSRAVRSSRLPVTTSSVARVLCRHVDRELEIEDIAALVTRLRLKLVAIQDRKWYVVDLLEPVEEETSVGHLIRAIPRRVAQALKKTRAGRTMRPEIETAQLGDLLYLSVQMVSETKEGPILYVATPPGQAVALVSSVKSSLLKPCVEGLGYKRHDDCNLYGRDIKSLLRIHNRAWNENADHLSQIPVYAPVPVLTGNGIDYTNRAYDQEYVENIMGPDPPVLTELTIMSSKPFFDPTRLDHKLSVTCQLKSEDIAKTLKMAVGQGLLLPTSDLFQIFHKIKSNKFCYDDIEEVEE